MKWFIKVLRHYADFSGRARRKEYWMFVLFNSIFAFAWVFLFTLVFALVGNYHYDDEITNASVMANLSYMIIMMLPSMAVTVRRLHDIGKSGWMILIGLIPFVGGVWLFVLMLMDSQPSENKYGHNPKTSPEVFAEPTKLKSAGVTLIVAASMALLIDIVQHIMYISNEIHLHFSFYIPIVSKVLLLIAGVFLTKEKSIYEMQKKGKSAMILLLIAFVISVLLVATNVFSMINSDMYAYIYADVGIVWIVNMIALFISYLLLALLAAFVLFLRQNKNLIRNVAIWAMVFLCLNLLLMVYSKLGVMNNNFDWHQIVNLLNTFNILFIAYIVFAGTFISKEQKNKEKISERESSGVLKTNDSVTEVKPNNLVGERRYENKKPISILDKYRMGLSYLDKCETFDEAKFREFNRITGNRFSDTDIETHLMSAKLMIKGMEDLKQTLRSTMAEAISAFEEVERNGIDLSKYNV